LYVNVTFIQSEPFLKTLLKEDKWEEFQNAVTILV